VVTPTDPARFRAEVLRRARRIEDRRRRGRTVVSGAVVVLALAGIVAAVSLWRDAPDATVSSTSGERTGDGLVASPVPIGGLRPWSIAARPDGTMWVLGDRDGVARLGIVSATSPWREVAQLPSGAAPRHVVSSISGGAWLTDPANHAVHFVSATGDLRTTNRPVTPSATGALGQDQRFWFAEPSRDVLVTVGEDGSVREHAVPSGRQPSVVGAAPNGSIAYGAAGVAQLGTVTTGGSVVEFALRSDSARVVALATGPGPALWFVTADGGEFRFGRIGAAGILRDEGLLGSTAPSALDLGPDGQLWFSTTREAAVSQQSFAGLTRRPVDVRLQVDGWAVDTEGTLWAADRGAGALYQLSSP
jgi:streptogramin lyase